MNPAKAAAEPTWSRLYTQEPPEGAAAGAVPPRSRLYCLSPVGAGTAKVECLTSYINRLAWKYRVGPRVLVAQEILPQLRGAHYVQAAPNRLGSFGRSRSMSMNGQGEVAREWAEILETLTRRTDLHFLTLWSFASGLPNWGLQRASPAWCAACYQEWREQGQPIYQPLLWTLQAVTVCLRHQQWLVDRCPRCSQPQSALAVNTPPGACTQCETWLGLPPGTAEEAAAETLDWQAWVWEAVEELLLFSRVFGAPPWDQLPAGIAACVEAVGGTRELARLANVQNMLFSYWRKHKRTPSLTYLLEVGFVLNHSPLQLMTVEPARLQASLHAQLVCRTPPQFKRPLPPSQGDLVAIQTYLQSVLAGQEGPCALRQVARHLGVGEKFLVGRFPHECAQITAQYQAYCAERAKQRVRQECDEVRHVMDALQQEGRIPSIAQVAERLSNPQILRRPEAKATWRSIRRQMELTEVEPKAPAD